MKYMLLIYSPEDAWSEDEREACFEESLALCRKLEEQGQFVAASPLQSIQTATSLKIRGESRLITDGPFAETHEQLGGYFIIDVDNLDQALRVASEIPAARKGTVEVRPLLELTNVTEASR